MIDPKAILESYATDAGLVNIVQAGNRDELNKLFEQNNPADFPQAAVTAWRQKVEPTGPWWRVWHEVDVLVCKYAGFDDPGYFRYLNQQELSQIAFNLFRLVCEGESWPGGVKPRNVSISALDMNMFDANLDAVRLTFEMPELQALCYVPPPPPPEE